MDIREYEVNEAANCGIMARLINYGMKAKEEPSSASPRRGNVQCELQESREQSG